MRDYFLGVTAMGGEDLGKELGRFTAEGFEAIDIEFEEFTAMAVAVAPEAWMGLSAALFALARGIFGFAR